jgi:hypothetical protein
LLSRIDHLIIRSSQSNNLKIKISRITNSLSSIIILKREMRDWERKKKERRTKTVEIKIEIRSSLFQTVIIFYMKLWLRRTMRPQKTYDDFRNKKKTSSSSLKMHLKLLSYFFLFFLWFFLRNCIDFHITIFWVNIFYWMNNYISFILIIKWMNDISYCSSFVTKFVFFQY